MSKPKGPTYCPFHEGQVEWGPCVEPGSPCGVMAEATLLQDRLDVIAALAEEARDSYLQNSDVMPGVSVSAALETVRLLARSITEDDTLKDDAFMVPGDGRVLLRVIRQNPRPLPTGGGGGELHLPRKGRPARASEPTQESEGGRPESVPVPAPTVAN